MTTNYNDVNVLVTGVSLPACCRPQSNPSTAKYFSHSSSSYLLLAKVLRVNSVAELSYVAWKCPSASTSSITSNASPQLKTLHSQWIPQRHVSTVCPATPDANKALGRGPHDSKFEDDNPRVELWSSTSGSMGRFTVAKQSIHMGERAFQAAAFAVIVRQSLTPRRCHWCFTGLRKKALQCGECQFTRYCSRDCLSADAPLHAFQCNPLRALKCRGDNAGVGDVETVRLALAVLSMELFVRNPHALDLLVVHRQREEGQEKEINAAVNFIVQMTNGTLDPKHVRDTLERVRCNAHPLYLDGVTCVGSGVFPEAAMALNHSCLPNVVPSFDPRTRTLAFHAIAEIFPGGAVEYSYIDLLQTRKRRQSLLAQGFGFDCICERCMKETAKERNQLDEDEEEETQVLEKLMQLVHSSHSDVTQRLIRMKNEYQYVFDRNDEAQFALYTAEMQIARAQSDWSHVIEAAKALLHVWTRCALPENYHTTETLNLQIHFAAKKLGKTEVAKMSAQRVSSIRQICGYSYPEALFDN
ncbi:hypothetical protein PHMEG_00030978 [Phytophthora megakarya]|uniref:MYND-type domain-containing protein n=1 Tax=Phytophthora megakarya TaxID=4795 RepID=A0A225UZQ3_9STRA|nr:hypothetical protein PHMEG_00030978 [Phytophthora megakarya]